MFKRVKLCFDRDGEKKYFFGELETGAQTSLLKFSDESGFNVLHLKDNQITVVKTGALSYEMAHVAGESGEFSATTPYGPIVMKYFCKTASYSFEENGLIIHLNYILDGGSDTVLKFDCRYIP